MGIFSKNIEISNFMKIRPLVVNTIKTNTNMKSECDSLFSKSIKIGTHKICCDGTIGESTAFKGGAGMGTKETRVEVSSGKS